MNKTGLIGWRGMVGSVLMERMRTEGDFSHIEPIFSPPLKQGRRHPMLEAKLPCLKMHSTSMHCMKWILF